MKKNTYDVPAYKMGIVLINRGERQYFEPRDYSRAISAGKVKIIPFEAVDGLLVSEVQDILKNKELYIQFFCSYQNKTLKENNEFTLQEHINLRKSLYFDRNVLTQNLAKPVDQVIEEELERLYKHMDEKDKRFANCFFERYQDQNYELTKQRIKRLEQQKKQNKKINRNR